MHPNTKRRLPYVTVGTSLLLAVLPRPCLRGEDSLLLTSLASPSNHIGPAEQSYAVNVQFPNHEPHRGDPLRAINTAVLLHCIAAVESGHDDKAIGRKGERGRYQIRPATWHHYGRGPFTTAAHSEPAARACALAYLRSLARILLDHDKVPTVYTLALLYNQGTLLTSSTSYAERVTNLYDAARPLSPIPSPLFVPPSHS